MISDVNKDQQLQPLITYSYSTWLKQHLNAKSRTLTSARSATSTTARPH
jgi:hypothetical protein